MNIFIDEHRQMLLALVGPILKNCNESINTNNKTMPCPR